ncbi:unnamed protein product [Thelazia callipaeda]|uniref:Secreted protein n=1 Tax=Thelazia callipaeda TaxID=103827 RepID=A0A0N5CMX5_THECL|nr:unnamed protein product [Thelazia callipaeda]
MRTKALSVSDIHLLTMKTENMLALLIIAGFCSTTAHLYKGGEWIPPRTITNLVPQPKFDMSSPECIPYREPCGFYSFNFNNTPSLSWAKSWCRCDKNHTCTYERTDMKMRIYRLSCTPIRKQKIKLEPNV